MNLVDKKFYLTWILLFAGLSNSIFAQTPGPDLAELEKTVQAELGASKTPGAAVIIVTGDRIVFAKGFGKTSAEEGHAVTPDTLFRMGSTTKMFTAASLVSLAAAGKVKLDGPIGNYVKNLPLRLSALTAHQLLSQSSGLGDFAALVTNDDAGPAQNVRAWKDDVFFTGPGRIDAVVTGVSRDVHRRGGGPGNLDAVRESVNKNVDIKAWREKFVGQNKEDWDFSTAR